MFSALSRISMQLFGINEIAFRLPVFLAAVLAVPLLYTVSLILLSSESAATFSCYLLAFSSPHLAYSQDGRGYALSVFFALAVVCAVLKLLDRKNVWLWGSLLTGFGFCMVLSIPSNVFFLIASVLFYVIAACSNRGEGESFFNKKLLINFIPFFFLFTLVLGYFYVIYPGLSQNAGYYGQEITPSKFIEVSEFLVSPWGSWLYIILAFALLRLKSNKKILPFICFFITPVILIMMSGFIGPARVYIYLLPFVLMLIAQGLVDFSLQAKKICHKKMEYITMAGFCIGLVVQPALSLMNYYPERDNRKISTIDSAMQISSYVADNFPSNTLIIIPNRDKTLLRYLDDRIIDNMTDIFSQGLLNKVVFIGHRDIGPHEFPLRQYYPGHKIPLKEEFFELTKEIGNVRIYNFARSIARFIPSTFDPDYEVQLQLQRISGIQIESKGGSSIVGRSALSINNETGKESILTSQQIKLVDIKMDEAYLLYVFARRYLEGSKAMLLSSKDTMPPAIAYLNEHQRGFNFDNSNIFWEVVYLLSPVNKGRQQFKEVFHLAEGESNFDGFQSFLLYN